MIKRVSKQRVRLQSCLFSGGSIALKSSARNMFIHIQEELSFNFRVISLRASSELMRIRAASKTSSKPISKATNVV